MVIEQYLDTLKFPESLSAFDFPSLVLPADHPLRDSVEQAQVRAQWSTKLVSVEQTQDHTQWRQPDFLTTRLDEGLVTVRPLTWNSTQKRLFVDKLPMSEKVFDLSSSGRLRIVLVAQSSLGLEPYLGP